MATVVSREPREVVATTRDGRERRVLTNLDVRGAVAILRGMEGNRFAESLVADDWQWRHRGGLTGSKATWAIVVAQEELDKRRRAAEAAAAPRGERIVDDFGRLAEMFRGAREGGRTVKVLLQTADGRPVMLALAGARSKAPGSVNVTDGRRYPDNTWYGRIDVDGRWNPGRAADDAVADLLRRFAADPARVAAEYGRRMGSCCFCQRTLTDDRSIHVGYGPVCADRWSLPWGERPAPAVEAGPVKDEADMHGVGPRAR